jgi:hypothetical protein
MTTFLVALQLLLLAVLAVLILVVGRTRYRGDSVPDLRISALRVGVVAVLFGILGWVLPALDPAVEVAMRAKLWGPLITLVLALLTASWLGAQARSGRNAELAELAEGFNRRYRRLRRDA